MINRLPENELLKQIRMQHSERLAQAESERRVRSHEVGPDLNASLPGPRQSLEHRKGTWSTAPR